MIELSQADILKNTETGGRFVIAAVALPNIILCPLDGTFFDMLSCPLDFIVSILVDGTFVREEACPRCFDIDDLPAEQRTAYERRLLMVYEIEKEYGPDFLAFREHKSKKALEAMRKKYGMTKSAFYGLLDGYFKSGREAYSLIDGRVLYAVKE